jgi:hypothetical protein
MADSPSHRGPSCRCGARKRCSFAPNAHALGPYWHDSDISRQFSTEGSEHKLTAQWVMPGTMKSRKWSSVLISVCAVVYAETSEYHLIYVIGKGDEHTSGTPRVTYTVARADELVAPASVLDDLAAPSKEGRQVGGVDLHVHHASECLSEAFRL